MSEGDGDAWLQALTQQLNWGLRVRQKRLDVSADPSPPTTGSLYNSLPRNLLDWCVTSKGFNWSKKTSELE